MGWYIQGPNLGKALHIVEAYGGEIIEPPKEFSEVPEDKALICVVSNGPFDAAAYCYNEDEFLAFSDVYDHRVKCWLTMDKKKAEELSGFKQ
jgi:hypothetical protein